MTTFDMNRATENAFNMDIYAIYLRKSRADEEAEKLGEGETLARHKKILTELAARKGYYIGEIYEEIVSGETIDDRPEMQRLISDCYKGKYKGILIVEVSRLSRGNQGDAQKIMDCLKYSNMNNGVLVVTPTKTYDVANNGDDEEYMEFELFMSRREYKMILKRMGRGRKQAVVEGNFMGSYRPYGYNIINTKTARTLVPNENEAPIVKKIFEWTIKENLSPRKIAVRLDNMGTPTYSGEPEWAVGTIRQILMNPTYIGNVRWNERMRVKTMKDGELVSSRPITRDTAHYMEYEGKHKKYALIDEETFKTANMKFKRDRTKANVKLTNPLAGVLVCKNCGKVIQFQQYKNSPARARYTHRQSDVCKVKSAYYDDVINAVIHALKLYIEDFELKVNSLPEVDEDDIQSQLDILSKSARKIEKKLSMLFDAWEEGDITSNELVERKTVNNGRLDNIKKQMRELENSIPEKEEFSEKIILFSEALENLKDDNLDAEIKNECIKRIISKIEYSRENKDEFILDIVTR